MSAAGSVQVGDRVSFYESHGALNGRIQRVGVVQEVERNMTCVGGYSYLTVFVKGRTVAWYEGASVREVPSQSVWVAESLVDNLTTREVV